MKVCFKCNLTETSRWYAGPLCNKCYCSGRRTPAFIKRQAAYDARPDRLEAHRISTKSWADKNRDYLHQKQTSEEGRRYFREYSREWRKRNVDKLRAYRKAYKSTSEYKQKDNERRQRNYERDPGKYKAIIAKRRAAQLQATPTWVDLKAIEQLYRDCPIGMEVDHIIPLQGKTVSGLHVPWNLQYLTKTDNCKKKNRLW